MTNHAGGTTECVGLWERQVLGQQAQLEPQMGRVVCDPDGRPETRISYQPNATFLPKSLGSHCKYLESQDSLRVTRFLGVSPLLDAFFFASRLSVLCGTPYGAGFSPRAASQSKGAEADIEKGGVSPPLVASVDVETNVRGVVGLDESCD